MESVSKKDLEWKFDADLTQVNNSKELVGLIVMLHVIPNLNSKLGDDLKNVNQSQKVLPRKEINKIRTTKRKTNFTRIKKTRKTKHNAEINIKE